MFKKLSRDMDDAKIQIKLIAIKLQCLRLKVCWIGLMEN